MTFVLDTNTVVDFFKGRGEVSKRLLATPPREIALPSVVLYELEVGAHKSGRLEEKRHEIEQLSSLVTLLPFGRAEAVSAARIRSELESQGLPIGPHDVLIAGTALAHGATLVTRNTREFERVSGLRVVDWF